MPVELFNVLIATCERCELLERTLASLAACSRPPGYAGTLVVENGAAGRAGEIVASADPALRARHLYVPDANKSAALNAALEQLEGGLVFLTDDDIRFTPRLLELYAHAAQEHPGPHFFGGPFEAEYEQRPPEWLRRFLPISAYGWRLSENPAPDGPALSFLGFNWAARVEDLRRVGGFNPSFGPGSPLGCTGQETEMQRRLKSAGVTPVYVPGAMVWHYIPAERCTPDWAIARARRNGLQVAMQAEHPRVAVAGLPLWVWRRMLTSSIRAAICLLPVGPAHKLNASKRMSYNSGLVAGFRRRAVQWRSALAR